MKNLQATGIGSLYIVATPIGNLEDISQRAKKVLAAVDLILAEDTRHSLPLLNALGIKNNLASFHAHNEKDKSKQLVEQVLAGKSMALISDAGTPLIADPGYPLVQMARAAGIAVIPIPGPCALITALSASGIPCDSFLFIGFLPAKTLARQAKLKSLVQEKYSVVCYESTHRILACLEDIIRIFGQDSELVLAKELTKAHEHFIKGTAIEVNDWLLADPRHQKGEFVLIIPPRVSLEAEDKSEELLRILVQELPLKQAVSIAGRLTDKSKNLLYDMALKMQAEES